MYSGGGEDVYLPGVLNDYLSAVDWIVGAENQEALNTTFRSALPSIFLERAANQNLFESQGPMVFRCFNPVCPEKAVFLGGPDFTAQEGQVIVPYWMLTKMGVNYFDQVEVENVKLPRGKMLRVQIESLDAVDRLHTLDRDELFHHALRGVSAISEGDTIFMPGKEAGDFVQFKVVEVESETGPCQAIELLNVDLAIDFLPPTDAPITPLAGQPPDMPWLDSAGQKVPHPVYTTNTGFQFFTDIEVLKNGGVTSSEPSTPDATDYVSIARRLRSGKAGPSERARKLGRN